MSTVRESRPSIRVRGRSLMALVLAPEPPVAGWLAALDEQLARSPGFFDGKPVIVDLAGLPREQPDVAGLMHTLAGRGVRIIGTEGGHPSWDGLEAWGRPLGAARPGRVIEVPDEPTPPAPPPPAIGALLVDHSVRSGQAIMFEGGDVTVVGSVASGAEIVAGGSIHVYGTLRGRAVAGVLGQAQARIFCHRLEAELLAIDGVYRTADELDAALHGRSVQAWLEGDALSVAVLD
ncbi:MAG TPA: septum site-determining protein MinC [Acetobacteraceae bacterium]|nr:septum site-determining protein MinC [Acetobacteraceae bacterium]